MKPTLRRFAAASVSLFLLAAACRGDVDLAVPLIPAGTPPPTEVQSVDDLMPHRNSVTIRTLRFRGVTSVTLRTPAPWDAAKHEAAARSGAFGELVETREIPVRWTEDGYGEVAVPALDPWGILSVERPL